ncbi:MAG: acyl carrier protein [Patescibacteria group bacterium]|jgi:acyl carrier protein|nr:acyl carrier protein [Patescibacteria group bacterium]
MTPQDDRFDQLRTLLAEMTGNDAGDIHPDSVLIDDLGIVPETDLPGIVKRINKDFEIHLNPSAVADEVESVEDLLTMISDEVELG